MPKGGEMPGGHSFRGKGEGLKGDTLSVPAHNVT